MDEKQSPLELQERIDDLVMEIATLQDRCQELERKVRHLEQHGYNGRIEDAHNRIQAIEDGMDLVQQRIQQTRRRR